MISKSIFLLVSLIVFGCASSKNIYSLQKSLTIDISDYVTAVNSKDYRKFIKFLPSLIVDSIGHKTIISDLKQFYEESEEIGTVSLDKEFTIDTILKIESTYWARIDHGQNLIFDLKTLDQDSTNSTKRRLVLLKFRSFYGEKNVKYDKEKSKIYIRNESPLYAFLENTADWKFIDYNWETDFIIPSEIKPASNYH